MFDELDKYQENDHFFLTDKTDLEAVCNAPADKSGVFVVYALKDGRIELIYIGSSGARLDDGSISILNEGLGGIKDSIVNGIDFGDIPRKISWKNQMKKENIEALDIYWFAMHNNKYADCPKMLEVQLTAKHIDLYGRLPRWNQLK
ncbi:MAG: hypothetical protein KA797_03650 [Chitinophagales bacterium]|nr:hypothetical protein [Chitinophagales bacterium]